MNPRSWLFRRFISRRPQACPSSLRLERLEDRVQPSGNPVPPPPDVRSIDGTGNNTLHGAWGSTGVDLLRTAPAAYGDGISTPAGANRPSARVVSNAVADQGDADIISDRLMSAMIYAWGQFIDHDLDLTGSASPAQPFNVQVPTGDPSFDPFNTGTQVIPLNRSASDPATGTTTPRQQVNSITAWLDGSMVYGSDATTAAKLRTHVGGRLKTSGNNMLPLNDDGTGQALLSMANDAHIVPSTQLYAAGDVRANENVELLSLQTLFVREHNRIADQLYVANSQLTDEQVYQRARAQVIAELQVITYKEWLPSLLGPNALRPYQGYNPNVNPGIANEFSTAAFRFGHSLLGDDVEFLDNNGNETHDSVALSQAFFYPPLLNATGIDSVLKYLSSDPSSEVDTNVVESVRNFLFGPPGAGGLDLASLNIQRGRDHGLADYNTIRAAYHLPKVTSFAQITSDPALRAKLQQLYGTVNNIDAWVGMLAEDHVGGGSTGPLLRAILVDQFSRIRDGDRFWYQRTFAGPQLQGLENTTLAAVIKRNTGLTNLQQNLFLFKATIAGMVFSDANHNGHADRREGGLPNVTMQLVGSGGAVVATTRTDPHGNYVFGVADGLRTGQYTVREVLPNGWTQTTPVPAGLAVTRGDMSLRVDFGDYQGMTDGPGGPADTPIWPPPTQTGPGIPPPLSPS
jgi:peroxidase